MYRHLYGLKHKPFQISADPAFLWLGGKHKEALAVLVYGVSNSKGFLLLSGGVGTGKTTLIRALLGQLDKKVTVATVHDPGLTTMDFFNFIAAAYGMRKRYTNKVDFLFDFEALLRKTRAAGRTALLIVDEAQRLDQTLLEEIRLLSNIEDPDQKLLNVFFVGQEEFLDIISDPQNRALKQRITINYHLETLSMEETEKLVRHRLKVAGATRDVFTPDAFPGIFAFSLGAPRLINILCDHALLTGFVHNVDTIGANIIAECTQDLMLPGEQAGGQQAAPPAAQPKPTADPKPTAATVTAGMMLQNAPPPAERRIWPWAAAAILLLAIGIGFLWQQGWRPLTEALHMAQVALAPPTAQTVTTPEPAPSSTQPETVAPPTPAPTAPAAASVPAPPPETAAVDRRDTTEIKEAAPPPTIPDRVVSIDARPAEANTALTPDRAPPQPLPEKPEAEPLIAQEAPDPWPTEANTELTPDRAPPQPLPEKPEAEPLIAQEAPEPRPTEANPELTPDRAFPQPLPEKPEAEPLIAQEAPDPRPTEDIATPDQVDPTAPDSDRAAPPAPTSPTPAPEAANAPADTTASPPKETLPATVAPNVPSPATPVTAARPEPAPPEQTPLATLPKPASSATTILVRELPAGVNATAPAPLPYPTEYKIRDFIHSYRKAYESRDINRFRLFFAADAMEQNRPIGTALPVYQHNFDALAALEYDITLKAWEEDEATRQVTLRGLFNVRYRMPESAWRTTRGEISMDLVETGGVYRIKRLDYWKQ